MVEKKQRISNTKDSKRNSSSIKVILGDVDYILLVTILTLVFFGVMMVFSASMYTAGNSAKFGYDTYYFLKRHFVYAILGIIVMTIASNFNYNYLKYRIPKLMYIVSVILLLLIYFTPLGVSNKGATRWIAIPGLPQFQPSDIAKATIMIWVPATISKNISVVLDDKEFFKFSGKILFLVGLVGKENLSTAIIMTVIAFGIIFISSPYTKRFVLAGLTGVGAIVGYLVYSAFFAGDSGDFRGGRFKAWLDPFSDATGKGFQTVQGLYAISSGGLFGLGFGKSRQKLDFIPEAHNDIIFAIICEELGLFGAIIVIFLFALLIFRGIKIALNAPNIFGSLTATGIVIFIATQTIINISVVTNVIPNTGIALPFISFGGTALIITLGLMGVLLNISRYTTVNRQ